MVTFLCTRIRVGSIAVILFTWTLLKQESDRCKPLRNPAHQNCIHLLLRPPAVRRRRRDCPCQPRCLPWSHRRLRHLPHQRVSRPLHRTSLVAYTPILCQWENTTLPTMKTDNRHHKCTLSGQRREHQQPRSSRIHKFLPCEPRDIRDKSPRPSAGCSSTKET